MAFRTWVRSAIEREFNSLSSRGQRKNAEKYNKSGLGAALGRNPHEGLGAPQVSCRGTWPG
jgi:hypothetical protein